MWEMKTKTIEMAGAEFSFSLVRWPLYKLYQVAMKYLSQRQNALLN